MIESPVLQEFVQEAVAERAHKMILRFSCLRMAMIESPPIQELVAAGGRVFETPTFQRRPTSKTRTTQGGVWVTGRSWRAGTDPAPARSVHEFTRTLLEPWASTPFGQHKADRSDEGQMPEIERRTLRLPPARVVMRNPERKDI